MDYFGVGILGALFGFGIAVLLTANRNSRQEDEIVRLSDENARLQSVALTYSRHCVDGAITSAKRRVAKRIERERKRGHGTPAGEA